MENRENNQSEQESSAVSEHRHEAALDFTRKMVEEIVSSARSSDK